MYLKRYTLAVTLFTILLGWYVYAFVTQTGFAINFFGINFPSLPVAVLVTIPLVLLYIATILHMAFYSLMGSFKVRKFEKDYDKLVVAMNDALLGKKNRYHEFKTQRYKELGKVLDNASIYTDTILSGISDEKIAPILTLIENIKRGEVVELKKYSLSADNEFVIQNDKNRYDKKEISAEDVLSKATKYSQELCIKAYTDLSKSANVAALVKYKNFITKEALFEIASRVNTLENGLNISNEFLMELVLSLDLKTADYIELSQLLSKNMVPEQRIKLFELLSEKKDEASDGYLYTLFDLEMIALADELLENSQINEHLNFKAYRALKECNKNFDISLFV